jgi:hypothetical protein
MYHPTRNTVNLSVPSWLNSTLAFLVNGFLIGLTLFSIFLVVHSSFLVNPVLGMVLLGVGLLMACVMLLTFNALRLRTYKIMINQRIKRVNQFYVISVLLFACGFIQTFYWVVDAVNTSHEPRSVFILASSGIIGYFGRVIQDILHPEPDPVESPTVE